MQKGTKDKDNSAAVAGGVVAGIVIVVAAMVAVVVVKKRRGSTNGKQSGDTHLAFTNPVCEFGGRFGKR